MSDSKADKMLRDSLNILAEGFKKLSDELLAKQPQPAQPRLVEAVEDFIKLKFPECEYRDPRRTCACRSCTWHVYRDRFKDALDREKKRQELVGAVIDAARLISEQYDIAREKSTAVGAMFTVVSGVEVAIEALDAFDKEAQ